MASIKKIDAFIDRQLKQIKDGGPSIIIQKMKRFVWILYMNLAAPLAVFIKMDWPKAYDFMIQRSVRKIGRLRRQPKPDKSEINKLIDQVIDDLGKYTEQIPDLYGFQGWMQNRLLLAELSELKNDIKQTITVHQRTEEVYHQIVQKHQLHSLGVEFIPRVLPQGAIGVYEYFEAYVKIGMLGLRPNREMILLLDPDHPVTNPCFLKYWSKYLTVVSDPQTIEILAPLEGYLTTPMMSIMHFQGKFCFSPFVLGIVRDQWLKENRPPLLALSSQDHERGWGVLRSMGMPQDAWFVTLHVREAGWKNNGSNDDNFRNADITSYFAAIKLVTDAGGWVIRIGDPKMAKLPAMTKVIDYAHSQAKSDWMDIFLCSQCRFMVGTSSGMCVVALTFGVPLVMTNLLPAMAVYYFTSKDLFIPRLCFSKDKERHLNFKELLTPPVGSAFIQTHFDDLNLRVVENSAEEIKDLVEEMLQRINGNVQYNEEDKKLQEQFRALSTECGESYADKDLNITTHMRIGRNFLRKYSSLLPSSKLPNSSIEV